MSGSDLRQARRQQGWTQAELAARLEVTQAYVCLLEAQRRSVPDHLAERLARLLRLPPTSLPVRSARSPLTVGEASGALAAVGYPGFARERARRVLNPADLLLRVLRAPDVDARVVEALPWLLRRYPDLDWRWVVREAKVDDLQNRLGFLLDVARELAERQGDSEAAAKLGEQARRLDGSRLLREDAFRASMTDAERRWLRECRSPLAAHWNVLSTVDAAELAHVD